MMKYLFALLIVLITVGGAFALPDQNTPRNITFVTDVNGQSGFGVRNASFLCIGSDCRTSFSNGTVTSVSAGDQFLESSGSADVTLNVNLTSFDNRFTLKSVYEAFVTAIGARVDSINATKISSFQWGTPIINTQINDGESVLIAGGTGVSVALSGNTVTVTNTNPNTYDNVTALQASSVSTNARIDSVNSTAVSAQSDATQALSDAAAAQSTADGAVTVNNAQYVNITNLQTSNTSTNARIDAVNSSLASYVPYTGATGDVDLGSNTLFVDTLNVSTVAYVNNAEVCTETNGVCTATAVRYAPVSLQTLVGTANADNLSYILTQEDGISWNITATGSGVDARFNFSNVSDFTLIRWRSWWEDGPTNTISLQCYNYNTVGWVTIHEQADEDEFEWDSEVFTNASRFINNTVVQCRFYTTSSSGSDVLRVDYVSLVQENTVPSPVDRVIGSGTVGYVPVWAGTEALSDSGIYYNGTSERVGINTSTPTATLTITGDLSVSTSASAPQFVQSGQNVLDVADTAGGDITGTFGALNIGTGVISDTEVSSLSWSELNNYPAACSDNETITTLGDTISCSPIAISGDQLEDVSYALINRSHINATNTGTSGQVLTWASNGQFTWANDQTGGSGSYDQDLNTTADVEFNSVTVGTTPQSGVDLNVQSGVARIGLIGITRNFPQMVWCSRWSGSAWVRSGTCAPVRFDHQISNNEFLIQTAPSGADGTSPSFTTRASFTPDYTALGSGSTNGLTVNHTTGFVGIGKRAPTQELDVNGDINLSGIVYAPQICLNGVCQTSWPSGSGGSGNVTATQTSVGALAMFTNSTNINASPVTYSAGLLNLGASQVVVPGYDSGIFLGGTTGPNFYATSSGRGRLDGNGTTFELFDMPEIYFPSTTQNPEFECYRSENCTYRFLNEHPNGEAWAYFGDKLAINTTPSESSSALTVEGSAVISGTVTVDGQYVSKSYYLSADTTTTDNVSYTTAFTIPLPVGTHVIDCTIRQYAAATTTGVQPRVDFGGTRTGRVDYRWGTSATAWASSGGTGDPVDYAATSSGGGTTAVSNIEIYSVQTVAGDMLVQFKSEVSGSSAGWRQGSYCRHTQVA